MSDFKNLMHIWKQRQRDVEVAEHHAFQTEWLIRRQVGRKFDVDPHDLGIGGWECGESPIGVCVYDTEEDPAMDDCLVCHHPRERK
jgi:hypothetical protein